MKAYISGPITGIENDNEPLFREWQQKLEEMGYETIVPHDLDPGVPKEQANWHDYMRVCLEQMMHADFVISLPEQKFSRGAEVERFVARRIDMPVIPYSNIKPEVAMVWPEGSQFNRREVYDAA